MRLAFFDQVSPICLKTVSAEKALKNYNFFGKNITEKIPNSYTLKNDL